MDTHQHAVGELAGRAQLDEEKGGVLRADDSSSELGADAFGHVGGDGRPSQHDADGPERIFAGFLGTTEQCAQFQRRLCGLPVCAADSAPSGMTLALPRGLGGVCEAPWVWCQPGLQHRCGS